MGELTFEEEANLEAAIKLMRIRVGSAELLARALQVGHNALYRRPYSPSLVFKVARLAEVSAADILTGKFPGPVECPFCHERLEVHEGMIFPAFQP